MTVGKVKEFNFGPERVHVKGYSRGGPTKKYAAGGGVAQGTKDVAAVAGSRGSIPGTGRTPAPVAGKAALTKAMERSYPKGATITPMRDPSVARASVKAPARRGVPVAPQSPLVAMKMGGMAKMRKC